MVTETTGVKIKTLLVPSKNNTKSSESSSMVSLVISNVAVTDAMLDLITNSFVVALITVLIASVGLVT